MRSVGRDGNERSERFELEGRSFEEPEGVLRVGRVGVFGDDSEVGLSEEGRGFGVGVLEMRMGSGKRRNERERVSFRDFAGRDATRREKQHEPWCSIRC